MFDTGSQNNLAIVQFLRAGYSADYIAKKLNMTEAEVKTQIKHINSLQGGLAGSRGVNRFG